MMRKIFDVNERVYTVDMGGPVRLKLYGSRRRRLGWIVPILALLAILVDRVAQ